jgi:hypothetical protein
VLPNEGTVEISDLDRHPLDADVTLIGASMFTAAIASVNVFDAHDASVIV